MRKKEIEGTNYSFYQLYNIDEKNEMKGEDLENKHGKIRSSQDANVIFNMDHYSK